MGNDDTIAKRRDRVLQLRAAGLTYRAIADEEARQDGTKPRAPSAVAADYAKALQARKGEDDTLRSLAVTQEVERLDGLLRAVETVRRTAARDGDQGMVLKAADRVLRIMERRAALLTWT